MSMKERKIAPQCQYSSEVAGFKDWLRVSLLMCSTEVFLHILAPWHLFSQKFNVKHPCFRASLEQCDFSGIFSVALPSTLHCCYNKLPVNYGGQNALSQVIEPLWCVAAAWSELCSCSLLSHSHDFIIHPFLVMAVLLFDTISLFNPWKCQKTLKFPCTN